MAGTGGVAGFCEAVNDQKILQFSPPVKTMEWRFIVIFTNVIFPQYIILQGQVKCILHCGHLFTPKI